MKLMLPFIIVTGIYYPSDRSLDSEEQDAMKALGKACYREFKLDKKLKEVEKKYIPEELKEYGGWTIMFGRIIIDKEIKFKWTF